MKVKFHVSISDLELKVLLQTGEDLLLPTLGSLFVGDVTGPFYFKVKKGSIDLDRRS